MPSIRQRLLNEKDHVCPCGCGTIMKDADEVTTVCVYVLKEHFWRMTYRPSPVVEERKIAETEGVPPNNEDDEWNREHMPKVTVTTARGSIHRMSPEEKKAFEDYKRKMESA